MFTKILEPRKRKTEPEDTDGLSDQESDSSEEPKSKKSKTSNSNVDTPLRASSSAHHPQYEPVKQAKVTDSRPLRAHQVARPTSP